MSRSRRRTPIVAMTKAGSEKPDKTLAHRAERTAVRDALAADREAPGGKLFGDPWKGDKDGKQYIAWRWPELLRK